MLAIRNVLVVLQCGRKKKALSGFSDPFLLLREELWSACFGVKGGLRVAVRIALGFVFMCTKHE